MRNARGSKMLKRKSMCLSNVYTGCSHGGLVSGREIGVYFGGFLYALSFPLRCMYGRFFGGNYFIPYLVLLLLFIYLFHFFSFSFSSLLNSSVSRFKGRLTRASHSVYVLVSPKFAS